MTSPSKLLHLDGREQTWAELEARNTAYWTTHDEWGAELYQTTPLPPTRAELIRMALQQRYPEGVVPWGTWTDLSREFQVGDQWVCAIARANGLEGGARC